VKNAKAAIILKILRQTYALPAWTQQQPDPFETLVMTIVSQNTNDHNTAKDFEHLSKKFEITPEALAKAEIGQIEDTIKPAGLNKSKARAIKQAAFTVFERNYGTLQSILSLPHDAARKILMQFQGVGPKTADVVLLFSAGVPSIPVDTHVKRVAKRLGFTPSKGNYESIRKNLESLFDPNDFLSAHLFLIAHGRKTCKARHPLCSECPVNRYCPTKGQLGCS